MAENPALKLSRILGGVLLQQGKLGHQVLGQLLIFNATDVEVAGANVLVAATSRHPDAVVQALVRVAAPAVALRALTQRQQDQLTKLEQRLGERQAALDEREAAVSRSEQSEPADVSRELRRASRQVAALRARHPDIAEQIGPELAALEAGLDRARHTLADARAGPRERAHPRPFPRKRTRHRSPP